MNSYVDRTLPALNFVDIGIALLDDANATVHQILGTPHLNKTTQRQACENYCAREGLIVDCIFIDEGDSAKTGDRPEFQRMLTHCREHKGALHHVVVYTLDRFARTSIDHAVNAAMLRSLGITVRSVTEPVDATITGRLMEGILAAVAEFDRTA